MGRREYNLYLKPNKYILKVESVNYKISENSTSGKDAVGTSYIEVAHEKEGLLNMEIPMERKAPQDININSQNKFGFMS